MAETRLADISEFQQNIDAPSYLNAGNHCLIVRAHNGWRKDNMWPGRRDYLRGFPFVAIGWYQYLVAGRDAAQQAREFIATVGDLRANEFVILDHEEGPGYQAPRAEAWFRVVDDHYGFPATLYAGMYYGRDNLGGWARWAGRPRWVAAYGQSEPTDPHEFWQYSSSGHFAGLSGGVDSSLYHGTDVEFLHMARPGAKPPATTPTPKPPTEDEIVSVTCGQNKAGSFHVFVEAKDGSLWYTWQKPGETSWEGGKAGVSPAALKPFAPAPKTTATAAR